jgi:hypothetical protein
VSVSAITNVLAWITAANAALFIFGAVQHAGIAVGPFGEPRIVPAAIVEAICGAALAYGATTLFRRTPAARRATLIGNVIALVGVIIGLVALALGAGPRTASNDLYHRLMLVGIGVSFVLLLVSRPRRRAPV